MLFVSVFFNFFSHYAGNIVDISSNSSNTFLTMPCSIETCHNSYKSLRSTDVRSSFFAFDMLFAHTQSHTKSFVSLSIDSPTDYTSRESTFEVFGNSEVSSRRTTKSHRNTETLSSTESTISTHFARSFKQCQSHKIGSHTYKYTFAVSISYKLSIVYNFTKLTGILNYSTKESIV